MMIDWFVAILFACIGIVGGVLSGQYFAWNRYRDRLDELYKKGPLHDLSKKSIRIERARGAIRGRHHAIIMLLRRSKQLAAQSDPASLELTFMAMSITHNPSPLEDVDTAPDDLTSLDAPPEPEAPAPPESETRLNVASDRGP